MDTPAPPSAQTLEAASRLQVLDRLTVGPVRIEPSRLTAPYRVEREGQGETTELILKYEEPVFEPGARGSENLAAMAAAQVALNYGLFAREIVLHGPLDSADRRFLQKMAENTAREIWVNKLLAPNPFLRPPATDLPAAPLERYCLARLSFPDAVEGVTEAWPGPTPDRRKAAVLSSGGKDSLLTHGLLDEMGYEVHALFGNEAGRHWFTALNAYRYYAGSVPHTGRVWMNADRVFTWMLRQLPFIRPDFASVRADIYPLRLWTVAVFLFAVLPLARRRGAGRILIGNEHDTTRRVRDHGISHYEGLYDQSRWFDEALSRYYGRKNLGIAQFSLLRPVSELVIQQTLAARYPRLHAQQVSCHAAHTAGERVRPCGRCEKCRRIVGMLLAGGFDPAVCGYEPAQVVGIVSALQNKDVHQSGADAEHLRFLLEQRGILMPRAVPARRGSRDQASVGGTPRAAREHPEVEQLRFDPERSPVEGLPRDLRAPFFRLCLQHTKGAVERRDRGWVTVDPLDPNWLDRPFIHEPAS